MCVVIWGALVKNLLAADLDNEKHKGREVIAMLTQIDIYVSFSWGIREFGVLIERISFGVYVISCLLYIFMHVLYTYVCLCSA